MTVEKREEALGGPSRENVCRSYRVCNIRGGFAGPLVLGKKTLEAAWEYS